MPSNYGRCLAEPRRKETILPAQGMLIIHFQCRPLGWSVGTGGHSISRNKPWLSVSTAANAPCNCQ